MRVIFSLAPAAMLVASVLSCGVEPGEMQGHVEPVAFAVAAPSNPEGGEASTGIVLCELETGSYGSLLPYVAIDGDGDGVTLPENGEVCTNGTLPPPYKAAQNGLDCNDADPAVHRVAIVYPDVDGDGVGATPRQIRCIGAAPPTGFSSTGYDEDDGDPAVIEDEEEDLLLLGA
jgi:hypothetical protein